MRFKLIRLLIASRFSKPLIALMVFVLGYSVIMGVLIPPEAVQMGAFWTYYIIGITAFFLTLMTAIGGVAIMKSDLDYLFTLPLRRRDLAVSLYITQFLATGISYLLMFGYVFVFIGGSAMSKIIIAGDMVLIGLLQTALSILSFKLRTLHKVILAAGMGIYALLPLVGFNYSITSIFTGNVAAGTLIIVALNVVFNFFALTQLSKIELGFTKVTALRSSLEYRTTERFIGLSRRAAIFRRYLSELSLTGRFNLGGSVSVKVSRIRLSILIIPMSALAAIYAYLAITFNPADGSIGMAEILSAMYIGIFIPMFSPEVYSHERAWLAFSSMSAKSYWRYVIYARIVQTYVILVPFIIANAFLVFFGAGGALNVMIYLAAVVPSAPVITMYISGRFSPAQIIELETMPTEFSLRQLGTLLPVLFYSAAAIISMFTVWLALGCAVTFTLASIAVLLSTRTWNRIVYRLTERGYV